MVVASGQMPYEYDTSLPIRALPNAWPGLGRPNIATSGDIFEQAMFVYNAELRKWNFTQLNLLTYQAYWHPNIASSGFEPKSDGETLTGLVGPTATVLAVDNIEQLRTNLETFLFDQYSNDSNYGSQDFMQSWLNTAYPESSSGQLTIHAVVPNSIYSFFGRTFLRPPAQHITGGNFVDTDIHWLGGSGVLFDIDCGEIIFQPFPFPREGFRSTPSTNNFELRYGPIYPICQNTLGNIPSMQVSRYVSDVDGTNIATNMNFAALGSGNVQIDGYVLLPETTIELVKGNDTNFESTVSSTSGYIDHIQGLRAVLDGNGSNDASARCYRTPTAQSSGLYRLLTHNQKSNVPLTAIASGFVSLWPQGQVTLASDGTLRQSNFIDGQQLIPYNNGTFSLDAGIAQGVHIFDDTIWIAGTQTTSLPAMPSLESRGMFAVSPFDGSFVWYRPAEMTVASTGNNCGGGAGPGAFGTHVGLMSIGSDYVRLSRCFEESFTFETSPIPDTGVYDFYWQRYNKQTLDHTQQTSSFTIIQDGLPSFTNPRGAITTGSTVYTWREFTDVHEWSTALTFIGTYTGPIAARRHYAGGDLLYTIAGNVQAGDPILSIAGGSGSGIGKWSISGSDYTHDSAKPLRAEHHFGNESLALIHSIFDVAGATHIPNGIWMIIIFPSLAGGFLLNEELFICRIVESSTEWTVVQSMRTNEFVLTFGVTGLEFPIEGVLQDLDN